MKTITLAAGFAFLGLGCASAPPTPAAQAPIPITPPSSFTMEKEVAFTEARARPEIEQPPKLTSAEVAQANERAREHAPLHVDQTNEDLERFAWVTSEPRGMVIRVPSNLLFARGSTELSVLGQEKLGSIAHAVEREGTDTSISIGAYTDTKSPAPVGDELTQDRAVAVQAFFVARGIAITRIAAHGFGPSDPMTENLTPEGRARNRRVEIVVALPTAH